MAVVKANLKTGLVNAGMQLKKVFSSPNKLWGYATFDMLDYQDKVGISSLPETGIHKAIDLFIGGSSVFGETIINAFMFIPRLIDNALYYFKFKAPLKRDNAAPAFVEVKIDKNNYFKEIKSYPRATRKVESDLDALQRIYREGNKKVFIAGK